MDLAYEARLAFSPYFSFNIDEIGTSVRHLNRTFQQICFEEAISFYKYSVHQQDT